MNYSVNILKLFDIIVTICDRTSVIFMSPKWSPNHHINGGDRKIKEEKSDREREIKIRVVCVFLYWQCVPIQMLPQLEYDIWILLLLHSLSLSISLFVYRSKGGKYIFIFVFEYLFVYVWSDLCLCHLFIYFIFHLLNIAFSIIYYNNKALNHVNILNRIWIIYNFRARVFVAAK